MAENSSGLIFASTPTIEGAGVKLSRVFGFHEVPRLDPFLLLDDFHSENPDDYIRGFPWHPHRGIETVTYMLRGNIEHGDSIGNKGVIGSGDVQWMTAGSGIIHQEMPLETKGMLQGFQLWINLPAEDKMISPRYREIKSADIPAAEFDSGVTVKIIAGTLEGITGPVQDIVRAPSYYHVMLPCGAQFSIQYRKDENCFAYIFKGSGSFNAGEGAEINSGTGIFFSPGKPGGAVSAAAGDSGMEFLFISGKPLNEPIAWRGPIVMNTEEELNLAFREYQNGTFLKS